MPKPKSHHRTVTIDGVKVYYTYCLRNREVRVQGYSPFTAESYASAPDEIREMIKGTES